MIVKRIDATTKDARARITGLLLRLPDVTMGQKFGGKAFFFRKRFFAHFHPFKASFFLETFVWGKVNDVVREIPGVIPHPEYAGYGWVRLPINSEEDLDKAQRLVEATYKYLRTMKRISLPKRGFNQELIDNTRKKLPRLRFKLKESKKTMQILIETAGISDYEEADIVLAEAANILKTRLRSRGVHAEHESVKHT